MATVVGLIVGLGILRTPGDIAGTVSDPTTYMLLWIVGGAFVLLTVGTVAELFALTPKSGGIYALVQNAFGPYAGFVIGWTDVMASCSAGAVKAVVLAEYAALLIPELGLHITPFALVLTTIFAGLQLGGLSLGAKIQQSASVGIGLIMIGLAIALFAGYLLSGTAVVAPEALVADDRTAFVAWGAVITAIVFTYDGWVAPTYFSGEMKSGAADVAVGAIRGTMVVIAFYIALNLALVLAVPLEALAGQKLALSAAIEMVYGAGAGTIVLLCAIFILLAHQNLQYMNVSRTLYALSIDGMGVKQATRVSDLGTPVGAVLFSWVAIAGLILAGGFNFLLSLTTFLLMLTYFGMLFGIFLLRKNRPDVQRPFRAWGYPYLTTLVTVLWTLLIGFVGYSSPKSVGYAIALIAISAPAYWALKRYRGTAIEAT